MQTVQALELPIQEIVTELGYELWGLEFLSQGKHSLLRVYIEQESGITVDDCAKVSHQVSAFLDVEDVIRGQYTLEVSSPGLDRVLFKPEQYHHYCGDILQISLKSPIEKTNKIKGELLSVDSDHIQVKTNQKTFSIPFALIQKTRLVPQF